MTTSKHARNDPGRPGAVGVVRGAELRAQQRFFRADSGDDYRHQEGGKQHARPRPKREAPTERIDEHTEIARVANNAVNAGGDQGMPGLDRHQAAEPVAEHVDGPNPQRAADGEQGDSKLKLAKGQKAHAVIKASDVMIGIA